MANLTTKEVKEWQGNIETTVYTKLINSLKSIKANAEALKKITDSDGTKTDEEDLSYRYKDLILLTEKAIEKLGKNKNDFTTDMKSFLNKIEAENKKAASDTRTKLDSFRERANDISKL